MRITEIHFDRLDSTSAYAKREYTRFDEDALTVISADEQTAGRGRQGRKWFSPKGVNLYATFCFRLPSDSPGLPSLAILGAYSVARLLEKEGLSPAIKWPNDVQIRGKKIAGVLCEVIFDGSQAQVLLGIGLNVNMRPTDLAGIDQPATSFFAETGNTWDRKDLIRKLGKQIASDLERFQEGGFAPFKEAIESRLAYKGKRIRCFDGAKEWIGLCDSLGKEGQIVLALPGGVKKALLSGDVHLMRMSDPFDEDLRILQEKTKTAESYSIRELVEIFAGNGRFLFLIFLSIPFCQPLQIPGLSTPFGLLIAFIGLRMGFGHRIWLPEWILSKRISAAAVRKTADVTLRVMMKIKRFLHPRMEWLSESEAMRKTNSILIFLLGLILALPLPIPLSNLTAAWAIFLLSLGVLEKDGLYVILSYLVILASALAFVFLILQFS